MADPLTWLIIGASTAAASSVAGAAMGTVSGISSYRQQEANANAQQEALEYNARQEQREADNVQEETQAQEQRQRAEQERLRASQRALYGKSGTAMFAGSPLAVLGETAANQQMENLDLRRAGATEYNRHIAQKNVLNYQSRVAGNSVDKGQLWGSVGGSILSGIGGVGGAVSSGVSGYYGIKANQSIIKSKQ